MELSTERQDGVLLANVSGRIDPKSAGALETAITGALQNGDRAVILDFEQLVYIGNSGIRALRVIARILRDRDAALVICSPQGVVAAVFSGGGVDTLITVHPTRAAALEALNTRPGAALFSAARSAADAEPGTMRGCMAPDDQRFLHTTRA